jgi:hypothetical protein
MLAERFRPMSFRDRVRLWIAQHLFRYWDEATERQRNRKTELIRLRSIRQRKNVERVLADYLDSDARIGR